VETFKHEYNLDVVNDLPTGIYDAVILSVAHDEFLSLDITSLGNENRVLYNMKVVIAGRL
jgi:UDP-N-acetyl-D-galactosamine dehydrogenase